MSTRKDVAKLAGVSVATVSYVLNNTKHVTPEVHKRVMDAVRELDYSPNLVAKSLATRQTRHVAMLVDNLKNPYYCELLEGIQELAARNGYIVSVVLVDVAKRKSILELAARGVDGIILALGTHDVREYVGKKYSAVICGETGCAGLSGSCPADGSMFEIPRPYKDRVSQRVFFLRPFQ